MTSRSSPAAATLLCAFCLLGLAVPAVARPVAAATYAGRSLEEALLALEDQGLKLIFTDRVVRPDMRVDREPAASAPRDVLAELLAPHGLTFRESVGGVLVIVPAEPPGTKAKPGATDGDAAAPMPMPLMVEKIDVTASRLWLALEGIASVGLDRDRLVSLPQIGDDLIRPLTLLPGTSGNDLSAQFSVRGGRYDEVMVRLDGLEILEPYHLKDFSNALSILAPSTIGGVELLKGGFSVEYGDRMGGVLDMTTLEPSWPRRTELGASALHLQGSGSGSFHGGRGSWLGSLRVGSLGLAAKVANEQKDPMFSDLSAKVEHDLGAHQSLRGNVLMSRDSLDFVEQVGDGGFPTTGEGDEPPDDVNGSLEDFTTSYDSDYGWLTHQAVAGRNLYFESMVSLTRVGRDRVGLEQFEDGRRNLSDERTLDVFGVNHGWSWQLGGRQDVKGGFEVRRLDAGYDYVNDRVLPDPLAAIREVPRVGTTDLHESFRGEHYGVYLADQLHPWQALSLELGLRYDENTLVGDENLSPRASLAWSPGARSRLRAAWGVFYQSQRPYELQVEDGETRFQPAERSEHRDVGLERSFGRDGRPLTLRVELYERRVHDPRVRFENLFDPVSLVPELEADRVRIAPESSRARGLEVFFGGKAGSRLDWFVAYTYARVEDRIGGRDVPRSLDQPHTLGFDLGYRSPWKWDFNVAVEAHSGWPTTAIAARRADGPDGEPVVEPVLGPLNGERLPDYFRLDLRVSRRWQVRRGELRFFLDVQNLTNADNVRGFAVAFETSEAGVRVDKTEKYWGPLFPSFGLTWSF